METQMNPSEHQRTPMNMSEHECIREITSRTRVKKIEKELRRVNTIRTQVNKGKHK